MRKLRQQSYGSTLFSGSSETMLWQNLKASRASRLATQGQLGALQAFNILGLMGMGTCLSPQVIRYGQRSRSPPAAPCVSP